MVPRSSPGLGALKQARHSPPCHRHPPSSALNVSAYAANKPVEPIDIERRPVGPHDVQIAIAYYGICHSDLHQVRSEWGGTFYPCVPGHEIVGHVTAVGEHVRDFQPGDTVGVGCMVDSCLHCASCEEGLEQYCETGFVGTYNGATQDPPGHTLGGYSQNIVVNDKFVLKIRHPADQLAAVAPFCARASRPIPLFGTGRPGRARRWGSLA